MIRVEMPVKDFSFIRRNCEEIERYFVRIFYYEDSAAFELQEKDYDAFLADYHSAIVRKGITDGQTVNDTGLRLNRILHQYIEPETDNYVIY